MFNFELEEGNIEYRISNTEVILDARGSAAIRFFDWLGRLAWRCIEDTGLIFGSVGVFSDFVLSASNLVID